jgi:dGTPase
MHKTQVFIVPLGDHYVTRLTHTLEVSQIARTISRALNLNEDLTEAISLGHDLGHTPFGHTGEDVLNELFPGGFRHNEQSLRVVELLENDGRGLNLTWEVRDGILKHSKSGLGVLGKEWGKTGTYEGDVCKLSDTIAWINHDIDDAIRAGILAEKDLPTEAIAVLGETHSKRIHTMVCDVIEHSWRVRTGEGKRPPAIGMSRRVREATEVMRDFLFDRVYDRLAEKDEADKARDIVRKLYQFFIRHTEILPPEYRLRDDTAERKAVDYIAGMTDQYATRMAEELGLV